MYKSSLMLLALSSLASFAADHMNSFLQQQQLDRAMNASFHEPLLKMKVFLKGGSRTPVLDSFRLVQGNPEIWHWEHESAMFKKGRKVAHRLSDIDSVVLEKHGMAFPAPTGKHWLFLQEAGAINYYAFEWDATGLPSYLKKGDGLIEPSHTWNIRAMVADDPEATDLIERYEHRWFKRLGIAAAGAGLLAGGLALAVATEEEDESGERKPSTRVPGIMALAGLVTLVVPLTPMVNFIWKPLPKRALDTYNRNRKSTP